MAYCAKCGQFLTEGGKFCSGCGANAGQPTAPSTTTVTARTKQSTGIFSLAGSVVGWMFRHPIWTIVLISLLYGSFRLADLKSQQGPSQPSVQGSTTPASTPALDASTAKDSSPSDYHSTIPFDISVKVLPPKFAGNDIASIQDALKNIEGGKSEYETTQQFRDRMNAERTKPIVGSLNYGSVFAFQVTPVLTHYDADRRILHADLDMDAVWKKELELDSSRLALTSLQVSDGGTDGVGTNAFGASRSITATNYVRYEVAFKRDNIGPLAHYRHSDGLEQTISISIPMGPDEASIVGSQTQALLICKLASPFVSQARIYKTATLDDPTEMHSMEFYVHVAPLDLWLYDPNSGKVIMKLASH